MLDLGVVRAQCHEDLRRWDARGIEGAGAPSIQPSLRDVAHSDLGSPSVETRVETLGYSHASLRDEGANRVPAR